MKRLGRRLLVLTALALAAVVLVLAAAVQGEPAVAIRETITHQDVAHVLKVLRWHDPRRNLPGRLALVRLDERDLEVLLGHGAQRWLGAETRVSLQAGRRHRAVQRPPAGQPVRPLVERGSAAG
jgi:hypothetical protein